MEFLTTIIYQPFFNLLVGFYTILDRIPGVQPDVGLAVILFTLAIRLILLPVTISSTRTKKERRQIKEAILKVRREENIPNKDAKKRVRKILNSNRRVVISEAINFIIQMIIFFILFRTFNTGLKGADLHLLYSFMPDVTTPFNLVFMEIFDLTKPSLPLNLLQSITILIVEAASLINSPFPITRNDVIRYVIVLPTASFVVFAFLPAGKKLFIITTLWFSFFFILGEALSRTFTKVLNGSPKQS